jgi:exopolysaccharide biosynthesis polyprenyl glycosylphosphotransferase
LLLKSSQIVEKKRRYLNSLIAFEATLILLLTVVAVQLRNAGNLLSYKSGLKEYILLTAFPIIWLVCLSLFGSWDMRILDNHIDGYRLLMGASAMTFLAFCSASYLFKIQISRFVILFSLVGGTLLHLLLRWFFLRFVDQKLKDSVATQHWLSLTEDLKVRKEVEEFAAEHQATMHFLSVAHSDFATWVNEVISKIRTFEVTRAILTDVSALQPVQVQQLMWAIQQTNAEFVAYDHLGLATSQSRVQYYDGLNWVGIGEPRINESLRVVKRLFDLTLVIPALILLTPIYLVIAILIKIDSRGKFLYSQQRIGQNGKLFTFPKFRSMKKGADLERLSVVGRPDENMADRYKNDPRITRVGKFLRRYSLDELPQLWCVLIGTMSLVGPRPILPEEEPQLGDFHFRRHIAKPGLTGIWQVSGRKETTWDDRMAFDIKYVEEWSVALDLILIARTFKAVINGKGSY